MKPVVLIVLDGLGHREQIDANAVELAHKTTWPRLLSRYPTTLLHCSGLAVGLPDGQMGNSEVGHTILGGGRIVYQDLVRISKSISDGDFFSNPELVAAVEAVKALVSLRWAMVASRSCLGSKPSTSRARALSTMQM